jgi:hypothetical protein
VHVKAPFPHQFPYKIEVDGHAVDNVIEANDETGSYIITYFQDGNILMDSHGHILVTHRRALNLKITPLPAHPFSVAEDEEDFLRIFDILTANISTLAGNFETVSLTRGQLIQRMLDTLDMVLDVCSGASPYHPGFVWVPVAERGDDGLPRMIPPAKWKGKDVVGLWEKWRRVRAPFPTYIETTKPPVAYHPENQ